MRNTAVVVKDLDRKRSIIKMLLRPKNNNNEFDHSSSGGSVIARENVLLCNLSEV